MRTRLLFVPAVLLLLGACAMPAPRTQAGVALPQAWTPAGQAAPLKPLDADWWGGFGSDELTALLRQASEGSFDLAGAAARVRQARALARLAGAPLGPDIQGAASAASQKEAGGDAAGLYTAGLSASYEVDVWGGLAAARDAALAALTASGYARDTVALSLMTEVASAYFRALALREQVDIARLSLATSERILALVEARARAGAATPLEQAQQRGLAAAQRRILAQREQQAQDSLTALAILLGRAPQGMEIQGRSLAGIAAPSVAAGVPADLLVRRPDLAQAERELAAADADVAAARAAMLPRLTLTAGINVQSRQWSGPFGSPLHNFAAGLMAPIFDGGRLEAGRDLALAQREELLAGYRRAIFDALGDVETALNAIQGLDRQRQAHAQALAQARIAVRLAESRYRSGAEMLLTVLDAQRTLYEARDEAAGLALARLQASIALFKAVGGGWKPAT